MFDFDPMSADEVEFSRKFVKLLIDFGKEGKPPAYLSEWKKLDLENPQYLVIDKEYSFRHGYPDKERLDFWRNEIGKDIYWNYGLEGNTLHDEL